MAYEPLHHKYRPQSFDQLVGQDAIAHTLSNALGQRRIAPAYLFCGPRGTGKTSSARILAKSLNCLSSPHPTATPCGTCEVCRGINQGATLDIVEIDAASNTGVDNIRELIERAQFAPVQCRYKVYVIDECLTGDSLVLTADGPMRIDNPAIAGKQVLSYNEVSQTWEFKRAVRWLDQGTRSILEIQTTQRTIRCTTNHLIRTTTGWIAAGSLQAGHQILSPAPVISSLARRADLFLWSTQQSFTHIQESVTVDSTHILPWDQPRRASYWPTCDPFPFQPWTTNLERVVSVRPAGVEQVYDIEVEDNHNFVANGLLVHNCHMLSTAAFNALLKTLEEPPSHVIFVLATTDPQRVLPTIISRCQRFDFRRIPLEAMVSHLITIADREAIAITPEAVRLVAQIAQGGLRDAESLLDQLSLLDPPVNPEMVWDLVGAVPERDLLSLVSAIAQTDTVALLDIARRLMDRGREPLIVLQNLAGFYRDLLIAKTARDRPDLVAVTPNTWEAMADLAASLSLERLLEGQHRLRSAEVQLKNTTQPRLWLEVTLLELLTPTSAATAITPANPVSLPTTPSPELASPSESRVAPVEITATQGVPPTSVLSPTPPSPVTATPSSPPPVSPPTPTSTPSPTSQASPPALQSQSLGSDLNKIWNQFLGCLPLGNRTLLQQHGQLLNLSQQTAFVGIKTQELLRIIQPHTPRLESAFSQVLQRPTKVIFEVTGTPENSTSHPSTISPPPPITAEPPPPAYAPSPPSASPAPLPPPEPPPTTQPWQPETDSRQVAKRLAEFFNGQIVELGDETLLLNGNSTQTPPPPDLDTSVPF